MSDFLGVDLRSDAPALTGSISLKQPHTVKEVKLPIGDYVFPLKLEYDRVNFTLEGQQQALEYHEPGILEMPEPDDEAVQPAINGLTDMWVMLGRVWC